MAALQTVVQRYPDRCVVLVGNFNIPDISWCSSELGWATPTTNRSSRRANSFIDACDLAGLKQYVCLPTRGANTLDLVLCNRQCITNVDVTATASLCLLWRSSVVRQSRILCPRCILNVILKGTENKRYYGGKEHLKTYKYKPQKTITYDVP